MARGKQTRVVMVAFEVEHTGDLADWLANKYADALRTLLPDDARISIQPTAQAAWDEINSEEWST